MELDLDAISKKSLGFFWKGLLNETEVEITLPDFHNLEFSVWGDWNPSYKFLLSEYSPIQIKYNGFIWDSTQKEIEVVPPILAKDRKKYPFFLKIEDFKKGVKFHIYLDMEYKLGKVEIKLSKEYTEILPLKEDEDVA